MLLSLFSGSGGLDIGFNQAGFSIGLAIDNHAPSIRSYNSNHSDADVGHVADVSKITLEELDELYGEEFNPLGVIGGPPCQGFSKSNTKKIEKDPRNELLRNFIKISSKLHRRSPLNFVAIENVPELETHENGRYLNYILRSLSRIGFKVSYAVLDAFDYGVPQHRKRLFIIGYNKYKTFSVWTKPCISNTKMNVRETIGRLPAPIYFNRNVDMTRASVHPNHWCMNPKSKKFFEKGRLKPGDSKSRSFRTLSWDKPSYTVAYGNREVHIHPSCKRRLSVYEAMLLQGYPKNYELKGTLSDQFQQVSQAVPPPLAKAVAKQIYEDSKVCSL